MPRNHEGSGLLPGIDDSDSKPVSRPRARNAAPARREIPTWRIAAGAAMLIVVGLTALYALHRLEQFLVRDARFALNGPEGSENTPTLQIQGAAHASERKIGAVFEQDFGRSVYLLPLAERRNTLRTIDWVKDATVLRLWPNRVLVRVAERAPVAFLALAPSRYALIDEDGVILPPAPDRFTLPVIAGVHASDSLAQRRERVHRMLRLTRDLGPEATAKISEIDVSDAENLRITEPWDGRVITLLLGDHDFAVRYQNFVRNYPEIKRRLPDATKLDLRLEDRITVVDQ
ncbi:MAG TPA: cell division protein FtsQ/DivIB [Bryobacteraceae bacterium]|jgi:cell division protein FtsQ|nr:cell division protein FtsQ/DivIB [Bryobacteraceae bacterium]